MTRQEAGILGGLVNGFIRKEEQAFLLNYIKMLEMTYYGDYLFTSYSAKKILMGLSNGRTIKDALIVSYFSKNKGKIQKQKEFTQKIIDENKEGFQSAFDNFQIDLKSRSLLMKEEFKKELGIF